MDTTNKRRSRSTSRGKPLLPLDHLLTMPGQSGNLSQEATLLMESQEPEILEIESEKPRTRRSSSKKPDFIEDEEESQDAMEEEISPKVKKSSHGDHCQVCYSTVSRKFLHGDSKDLYDLLQCRMCGINVHKVCYGIKTPFDMQVSEKGTSLVKFFLCDHCKEGDSSQSLKCFICDNKEGCLRRSTDNKWFHTLCVIGSPKITFKDITTMSVDLSGFRKNTSKIPVSRKCRICNNRIQTFGCINRNSDDHCHLNCALREKFHNPVESEWKIFFSLADEEDLKVSHCADETAVITNIRDLSLSLEQVIERTGMSGSFKKLKASSVRESAQEGKKSRGKHTVEASKYDKELYETAKNKAQANLSEGLASQHDEEEDDELVGGRVIVIKTVDVDPEDEDLVLEDEDDDIEDDLKNVIDYSTPDSLIRIIEDLYKELSPNNNLLEVYKNNQVKVKEDLRDFPKAEKLSFPEVLLFVNVFYKRAQVLVGNLCQISAIEALLKAAKMIPFPLNHLIKSLNTKYFTGLALDSLLQSNIEQCRPESAYEPSKKKFDDVIIQRNTNVLDQVSEFETIYLKKPVKLLTSQYEELRILKKQLGFLKKVYEEIADDFNNNGRNRSGRTTATTKTGSSRHETPNKQGPVIVQENFPPVPLSKISELNARAKASHLPEDFEEIQLLKDCVGGKEGLLEIEDFRKDFGSDLSLSGKSSPRGSPRKVFEGSKGIVKIVEVIPAAPETLKTSKRGRPKKAEKNQEELEDEHKEQLKRLLDLPTIKETEEALEKARRGMEFRKVKVLEANLKSVEQWKVEFERAVERNDGTLGGLIERIEMVEVYVPEMKRAMELRRSWSLWQLKVSEIQRKMKKRVESLFEETGGMVPFKDLEKVIQEGENVVSLEQNDGVVRKLEEKYKRICEIREEFNSGGRPDFGKLEEWKKEIMEMNVKLPEMSRFVATIAINENLKRDIEDKISLDKLSKKLEGSEYVSERVDSQLFEKLKGKVAEGKRIQDQAKELLKKRGSYEVQEIAKLALLSRDLLSKKLNIPEENSIDKIVSEFLEFISKVYDVITGGIIEHKITLHTLLAGDYDEDFQRKTINELIEKCKREGHGKLNLEKAREIEKAFEASEVENMKIASLREFYKSLSIPLWKVKAKGLLDAEQKTYQEIQKFINDIPPIEQVSDEDIVYLKKIQQVEKKISAWDKEVKDLLEINSKEHFIALMDEAFKNKTHKETFQKKLDDIVDKMTKPMDQYNKEFYPYSDLEKRIRALKKAIGWVKWISSALEIRSKIINEDVEKVEYEKIKEMHDKMQKFTLPDSKGLCKQIADWYRGAEKIYKDFLSQYEKKRVTIADKKSKENLSMAKLIKKNEDKISIEEAERILEKLKKGTKEVEFPEQVRIIEKDLKVLDEWSSSIKEITKKVREGINQEEEEAVEIELEDGLEGEIEELKQRMLQVPIRDEDFERGLEVLDWTYDAARVKTQSITVEILRKLIKYGEKLNIEDRDVQKLLENLKEEHTKAKGLVSFVEKLQKIKSGKVVKKVPYEELLKKREELETSTVDFTDEKKVLNEVYQETRELKEDIDAIFEEAPEEKVEEETLKQLLKKLKKGVVDLGAERKRLEDALAEGDKLANELKKKKRGRSAKWLNQMMERYKESVIYIEQAEKLNQESQELEYKIQNVPEEAEAEESEEEEPVERLTKAREEKPKREKKEKRSEPKPLKAPKVPKKKKDLGEVNAEKVEEFKKRAELMERRRFGSRLGPTLKISPTEMRKIHEEGERLKELYPEDERLADCADFVREIGGLVEAQVQEIKKVKKVKQLEELERIGLGFIDFNYTITARKTALNKSPKKKVVPEPESDESGDDTLRLIPKKKERRESRSISEERGRISRERSRERERTSERKKKSSESPAKTRSKERVRQELVRNIHQREYERNSLVDRLRRGEEERISTYYGKLINEKALLKSKQVIIAVIKHLLNDCPYIALDFFETFRAANELYYALPELRQSRDLYDTTISRLRAVLSCRHISRSLVELNFDYTYIRTVVHQGPRARQELEETLAEQALAEEIAEEDYFFDGVPAHDDISVALEEDDNDVYYDRPIHRVRRVSSPIPSSPRSPQIPDHGDDEPEPEPAVVQATQTDAGAIKIQPIILQPHGRPQQRPQVILYNPDSPKPAEQPDNVSISEETPAYNPDIPVPKPKKPKNLQNNAIIKIFNGTFGFDQNKISPNFNMFAACRLSSKNEIQPDTVLRIPALDGRKTSKLVKVTQWMPTHQFHTDFSQVVQYWRKQDGKIQVLAGWIEPAEASEAQYFTDLAQNLLDSEKVAVFNYSESAKMIVMNKYQMRRDWALQLNLRVHKTQEDSQHVLLFVIIQDPSRLRSIIPSISPVLVKTLESSSQEDVDDIWRDGSESPKLLEIESSKPQPPKPILKKPQDLLGKRPYEENPDEDDTIKELANLVKKIKNGDRTIVQTLMDKLRFTKEEDIGRLAASVDQQSRDIIVNIIKNLYPEEDSSLPRIVPPKPKETLTTTVAGQIKAGGKFTPMKFTPQMTTGSTAASPGRLLQDNTSMKSTPTNLFGERPIESQVYIRDPDAQRNQDAFASLQPSASNLPIIKPREEMTIYASVGYEEDVFKAIKEERKEEKEGEENYVKLPLNWSKLGPLNLVLPKVTLDTESELFVVKQSTFEKMMEYKRNRGDFGPTGEQEEEEVEEGEIQEEQAQEAQEEEEDLENLFQD